MTASADPHTAAAKRSENVGLVLSLGISLVATLAFALVVRGHAHFHGDDYIAFHDALTQPIWEYLLTPIDVHYLPLHRLATWLIYRIAPLNFDVALGVMCVFHLLGLWMLYRSLELIGPSRLNAPLTVLCGTNFYLAVLLLWWTSGIARFPCIFLSLTAIYHYLRFRQSGSLRRLGVVVPCLVGASAFFSKGLLVPGFLGALELAFFPETPRRDFARNVAAIAVAGGIAVAYRLLSDVVISGALQSPPLHWRDQVAALQMASMTLHQGVFGLLVSHPLSIGNWLVVGLWLTFFLASLVAARFNAVVWLLALVTLAVNFLIITLSPRMRLGPLIVTWERYYFDVMFLIVLFVAILVRRMVPSVLNSNSRAARVAVASAWFGVLVSAWLSQQSFLPILESPRYNELPFVRTYANNLKADLAELRRNNAGTLAFANGFVPRPVLEMGVMTLGAYSKFLPVFDSGVRVFPGGKCLYVVQADGRIASPPEGCRSPSVGPSSP